MPKISVLMSVYINDSPEFLKQALESIFESQTKKPDEIVVVFDGPLTNEQLTVLQSFRHEKENIVKYLPQNENKGLGEALRIGSLACSGEYIIRMDSDDISAPNRIETLYNFVLKHPEFDVVGSTISEFSESPNEKDMKCRVCPTNNPGIIKMSKRRNPMNHVSVCIKKSSLLKSGGYMTARYVEDYYLWIRMLNKGCLFYNINEPLVYVRIGNGFLERRSNKIQISSWKLIQKYMLRNKMIGRFRYFTNMLSIRVFIYMPLWAKRIIYSTFLRK